MKNNRAFTLIELLVVISIISLLSSIVLASLNTARAKARDAKRLSDVHQIQNALAFYYDKYGVYPYTPTYGEDESTNNCGGWDSSAIDKNNNGNAFIDPLVTEGYFSKVPVDPANIIGNSCTGTVYRYYRYPANYPTCNNSKAFYVIGINDMESSNNAVYSGSPGWSCNTDMTSGPLSQTCTGGGSYGMNCRNWQNEFEWVAGVSE